MAGPERGNGDLGALLRILADPTRLRILALVEAEELSVGELTRALDLAQSRVSNHLRLLRDADLLVDRKVGTSTYLRSAPLEPDSVVARVWATLLPELDQLPDAAADRVRLAGVLAARGDDGERLFDRLAGEWDKFSGAFTTGRARERAAAHLLPAEFVLADLGCGTGYMAEALVGNCSRLICVDRSEAMLSEARRRLKRTRRHTEVEYRQGDLDRLPIETGELDGLVVGLVLHHLPSLDAAVAEMRRVLKPGGTAGVLELAPHKEAWMREVLGDHHLGLEAREVLAAFERAGFEDLVLDPVEDRYQPRRDPDDAAEEPVALGLYVVRGRAPRG